MGQFIENIQYRLKTTSSSLGLITTKQFVGFVLGLFFALIGQEMTGYGTFSFLLVVVTTMAVFYRVSLPWKFSALVVFALICVLIALLLRMYILVAPGA
jgi:hypothetical protein